MKNSKTEKNLLQAFAGESQARNRYTYYAEVAAQEGYIQISKIFLETADQESEHAKIFFNLLNGGEVELTCAFLAGTIGTTMENLEIAANGEQFEHSSLYPAFAKIAQEEGFSTAANAFRLISIAEAHHEKRYRQLLKNLKENQVFKKSNPVEWRCIKCGYIHHGLEAPHKCPACTSKQAYFETLE